ncbi:hypothetical protein VNO80_25250 [Phaseolus coccineus]|uniref:Uncharacterized protein n=1 Tax=Phaseolus coccineus TaxID=3886 RepID=A0AAN9QT60_PHACN
MVIFFPLKYFIIWEIKQWARHLVLKRITEHVLSRHLSLSRENIVFVVDQLDFSLLHGAGGNEHCEFSLFWSHAICPLINCYNAFEMTHLLLRCSRNSARCKNLHQVRGLSLVKHLM